MPYQLLTASQEIVVVPGGAYDRPCFVWVQAQNLGSGLDLTTYTSDGLTEINRTQQTANVTGDPWDNGPWPYFIPELAEFRLKNRNAGTSVYCAYFVAFQPWSIR